MEYHFLSFYNFCNRDQTVELYTECSDHLPVIKGVNKIAGGVVGWCRVHNLYLIGFLILTLLSDTMIGKQEWLFVEQDTVLNFLYNQNIFCESVYECFLIVKLSTNVK